MFSNATCVAGGKKILCTVVYRNLEIKQAEVAQFLDAKYGPADQDALRPARLAASAAFEHDAVGVLMIELLPE